MDTSDVALELEKSEAVPFHAEATTDNAVTQRDSDADKCLNTSPIHAANAYDEEVKSTAVLSNPVAAAAAAAAIRNDVSEETERSAHIPQKAASFRPNLNDGHRDPRAAKPPPGKDLDPLSTFIMLRSQQTAPVTATPPPGRL